MTRFGRSGASGEAVARQDTEANQVNPSLDKREVSRRGSDPPWSDSSAEQLIRIEGELRLCRNPSHLWAHLVNETAPLLPAGQAIVLSARPGWRVQAVSGVAQVQRDAPMVQWYERLATNLWQETAGALTSRAFELPQYCDDGDPRTGDSSLRYLLWVPLVDAEQSVGAAWLLAGDRPWEDHHIVLAERLAGAYAHGVSAIRGRHHALSSWKKRRPVYMVSALVLAAVLLAFVSVPLTTRAPVEVVARDPFVVAAPMAGVVERILVPPGTRVRAGEPLVKLVDVEWRNEFEVAQRQLEVARTRTLRLRQAAISDPDARRELAIAQSEQRVAEAERDYRNAILNKAIIHAMQPGVALYSDPQDWVGRPVRVGEALMQVANPDRVEFRIKVPAADAVNLQDSETADIFLDAAPLEPIKTRIVRAAYKAEADAAGIANFTVIARAQPGQDWTPRLGLRGTARLHGQDVSLFYYLFRRPIVAVRQLTGI